MAKYNKNMGGVDRMDENISNYRISIRSRKWWWSAFVFGMETAMHNAWRLYAKAGHDGDFLFFRRSVVQTYLLSQAAEMNRGLGRPSQAQHKVACKRVPDSLRYSEGKNHYL